MGSGVEGFSSGKTQGHYFFYFLHFSLVCLQLIEMLTSLPHDKAILSWCQLEATKIEASSFLRMLLLFCWWCQLLCVCACVCVSVFLSGRLLCQAGEGVGNSSTHLGIKLMCWDQGPVHGKLFLWLKAIIGMGREWSPAAVMAEKPNTCRRPVPGQINTYISIYPLCTSVVIRLINNGPRWCVGYGLLRIYDLEQFCGSKKDTPDFSESSRFLCNVQITVQFPHYLSLTL